LRFYSQKMRRNAVPLVAQHIQHHIAGEEHVRELVHDLELQRLRLLERWIVEKCYAFDRLSQRVREFGFFVSHLS